MVREKRKKGERGRMGEKEGEREREGVFFYSYLVRIPVDPMLSVITLE